MPTQTGHGWREDALRTAVVILSLSSLVLAARQWRQNRDTSSGHEQVSSGYALFMAGHGMLSLVVFVLFVVYAYLAQVAAKRQRHFFAEHPALAWSFVGL